MLSNKRIVNVTQVHENNQSILNIKNVYRTERCPIKLNEKFICRAYYSLTSSFQNMCVNHSCVDVLMPQQLLHSSNVIAIFQQMCCKGMSERMPALRSAFCKARCIIFSPKWCLCFLPLRGSIEKSSAENTYCHPHSLAAWGYFFSRAFGSSWPRWGRPIVVCL